MTDIAKQFPLLCRLSEDLAVGRWVSASNHYIKGTGEALQRLFEYYSSHGKFLRIWPPQDPQITLELLQAMERVLELAEEVFAGESPRKASSKLFKDPVFCKAHQSILNITCPQFKFTHMKMSHLINLLRRGGLLGLSSERFLQACWESPLLTDEPGWYKNFIKVGDMRPCSAHTGAYIGKNPMFPLWALEQSEWVLACLDSWYASKVFVSNPRDAKHAFSVEAFRSPNRRKVELFLSTQSLFYGEDVYQIFLRAPWIRMMLDQSDPLEPFSEEFKAKVRREACRWDMLIGFDDGP